MTESALLFLLLVLSSGASGQDFNEKRVLPIELSQGFIKSRATPELFVGQVSLAPQWKLIDRKLRAGLVAGGFFTAGKVYGLAGPQMALKIAQLGKVFTTDVGNIHLTANYQLGTKRQQLVGGGIHADLAEILLLSLRYQRDVHNQANWFQVGLAYHLFRKKIPTDIESRPTPVDIP
jgi:hypothetical protein